MMFVYIFSTHVITLCTRFDICSSGKVNSPALHRKIYGNTEMRSIKTPISIGIPYKIHGKMRNEKSRNAEKIRNMVGMLHRNSV